MAPKTAYTPEAYQRRLSRAKNHQASWRANNPERATAIQWRHALKKKYGLTPEGYDEMWVQQLASCAICDTRFGSSGGLSRACVDHDHATGRVRALLCFGCNTALGKFKEDPAVLRRAAAYLEG